jgi:hypothetical protein
MPSPTTPPLARAVRACDKTGDDDEDKDGAHISGAMPDNVIEADHYCYAGLGSVSQRHRRRQASSRSARSDHGRVDVQHVTAGSKAKKLLRRKAGGAFDHTCDDHADRRNESWPRSTGSGGTEPDGDDRLLLLQKKPSIACRSSTSIVFAPRIGRDRHGFYQGYLQVPPPHLLTISCRTDYYAPYDKHGTRPREYISSVSLEVEPIQRGWWSYNRAARFRVSGFCCEFGANPPMVSWVVELATNTKRIKNVEFSPSLIDIGRYLDLC